MTLEEYLKQIGTQSDYVPDEPLYKDGGLKVTEIDTDERTVTAIISTDVVDRQREVLLPKGVQLENYQKNPVVPWSHDSFEPPIAKALWVKKGTKKITARIKFALTERAEEVWQLFKGGFLKAFSVGFMPVKGHSPEPDEIRKRPEWADARWIFDKWELLEFSPVTIPANPEALAVAVKSKEIKLSDDLLKELEIEDDAEETFTCADDTKMGTSSPAPVKTEGIKVKAYPIPVKAHIDVDAVPDVTDAGVVIDIAQRTQEIIDRMKGKVI